MNACYSQSVQIKPRRDDVMQMTKEAKAYQKPAWIIRLVFLLAGLMIAGGGIWYVAITGII